jgi:hypothetical protein
MIYNEKTKMWEIERIDIIELRSPTWKDIKDFYKCLDEVHEESEKQK